LRFSRQNFILENSRYPPNPKNKKVTRTNFDTFEFLLSIFPRYLLKYFELEKSKIIFFLRTQIVSDDSATVIPNIRTFLTQNKRRTLTLWHLANRLNKMAVKIAGAF